MQKRLTVLYIYSAGLLFLVTAAAKLVSSAGKAQILQTIDPVFSISFRHLFLMVGIVEVVVGLFCLLNRRVWLRALLVAWLATDFVAYRLGLSWVGYNRPCHCLGSLTDALHIPPQTADNVMKIILAYLFIGSYAILFSLWCQNRRTPPVIPSDKKSVSTT